MNGKLQRWGVVMAVAGALLLAGVMFLICLVLDLAAPLTAIFMAVAAAAGAWYGLRLTKGAVPTRTRPGSGHGSGRH